ncbi:hypothetical protein JSQ81_07405 [Sporosarcina sp. Marseille-Q4063]|uniref:hypothetical protein n=1 Tax=Sporosarcina sp. Marseille-Q4063 TaxID=2810514 RepID=UPI001BB02737|nr:hypothetical protein [Sporosarcina sp. Marseille-Q4063]QUW23342.1 hypothetical protein JSQ81_07405 [Sporosarcina sp. Marseille-Q4063]
MQVYQSDDKFVLAVEGGQFREFDSVPKAIITNNRPVPTRMWLTPEEKDIDPFKDTFWLYNYEFREFLCDDNLIHILKIDYTREKPSYAAGEATFFLDAEYVHDKIEELRGRRMLAEYHWDANVPTWIEIERGFKYDDEDEEEDDEEYQ